ncbi:hypothetical protein COK95_09460 [Bacillus thuringiensis]|nr:hypothetical protein COK95_09460 [Bacillus thuringiensis]RAS88173.1 hypothetical protein A6E21_27615 [Bacillus cereus]
MYLEVDERRETFDIVSYHAKNILNSIEFFKVLQQNGALLAIHRKPKRVMSTKGYLIIFL